MAAAQASGDSRDCRVVRAIPRVVASTGRRTSRQESGRILARESHTRTSCLLTLASPAMCLGGAGPGVKLALDRPRRCSGVESVPSVDS